MHGVRHVLNKLRTSTPHSIAMTSPESDWEILSTTSSETAYWPDSDSSEGTLNPQEDITEVEPATEETEEEEGTWPDENASSGDVSDTGATVDSEELNHYQGSAEANIVADDAPLIFHSASKWDSATHKNDEPILRKSDENECNSSCNRCSPETVQQGAATSTTNTTSDLPLKGTRREEKSRFTRFEELVRRHGVRLPDTTDPTKLPIENLFGELSFEQIVQLRQDLTEIHLAIQDAFTHIDELLNHPLPHGDWHNIIERFGFVILQAITLRLLVPPTGHLHVWFDPTLSQAIDYHHILRLIETHEYKLNRTILPLKFGQPSIASPDKGHAIQYDDTNRNPWETESILLLGNPKQGLSDLKQLFDSLTTRVHKYRDVWRIHEESGRGEWLSGVCHELYHHLCPTGKHRWTSVLIHQFRLIRDMSPCRPRGDFLGYSWSQIQYYLDIINGRSGIQNLDVASNGHNDWEAIKVCAFLKTLYVKFQRLALEKKYLPDDAQKWMMEGSWREALGFINECCSYGGVDARDWVEPKKRKKPSYGHVISTLTERHHTPGAYLWWNSSVEI